MYYIYYYYYTVYLLDSFWWFSEDLLKERRRRKRTSRLSLQSAERWDKHCILSYALLGLPWVPTMDSDTPVSGSGLPIAPHMDSDALVSWTGLHLVLHMDSDAPVSCSGYLIVSHTDIDVPVSWSGRSFSPPHWQWCSRQLIRAPLFPHLGSYVVISWSRLPLFPHMATGQWCMHLFRHLPPGLHIVLNPWHGHLWLEQSPSFTPCHKCKILYLASQK